jgi:hypothetical protein
MILFLSLSVAQAIKKEYGNAVEITITADKFYESTTSYAAGGLWEVSAVQAEECRSTDHGQQLPKSYIMY